MYGKNILDIYHLYHMFDILINYNYNCNILTKTKMSKKRLYTREEVEKMSTESYMRGMSVQAGQIKQNPSSN
jgi:hypothetical protein